MRINTQHHQPIHSTMSEHEFYLGIDIGSTKVAAVLAKPKRLSNHTMLQVIGMGSARNDGVHRGNINNPIKTKEAIRQALEMAAKKAERTDLLCRQQSM